MSFAALAAEHAVEKSSEKVGGAAGGAIFIIYFLVFAFIAFVFALVIIGIKTRVGDASQKKKRNQLLQSRYGAISTDILKVVSGLPLVSGSICDVLVTANGYTFLHENKIFQLAFEKIHDVALCESRRQYQQAYQITDSNRIRSQTLETVSYTLNFVYEDSGFLNEIVFACPSASQATPFVNAFKMRVRAPETVNL